MVIEHLFWSDKEINRIYNVDTDHNLIHVLLTDRSIVVQINNKNKRREVDTVYTILWRKLAKDELEANYYLHNSF